MRSSVFREGSIKKQQINNENEIIVEQNDEIIK